MKTSMKKWSAAFLVRAALFLAIAFVALPLLILQLSVDKPASTGIPLLIPFLITAGTLLVMCIIDRQPSIRNAPLQQCVCALIGLFYAFLLMKVTYDASLLQLAYPGLFFFVQTTLYTLALAFLAIASFSWQFFINNLRSFLLGLSISIPLTVVGTLLIDSWKTFLSLLLASITALLALVDVPATLVTDPARGVLLSLGGISAQFTRADVGVYQLIAFGVFVTFLALIDRKKLSAQRMLMMSLAGLLGVWLVHVLQLFLFLVLTRNNPFLAGLLLGSNTGWVVFALYVLAWYRYAYPVRR